MGKNYDLYSPYQRTIDNLKRRIRGYEKMKKDLTNQYRKLNKENQKLKELQCTFQGTGCQNKMKKYKEVIDKAIDFIEEYNRNRNCFKWNEQDYIEVIDEIYSILKEVYR